MLKKGSAPLCGMFRRALACNLPERYTIKQVAYIFDLEYALVEKAAKEIGADTFTEKMLPRLFEKILF